MPRRGWASRNAAGFARRGGQEVAASMPPVVHYRYTNFSSGQQWTGCELRITPDDVVTDVPSEVTCPTCQRTAPHPHPFSKRSWPPTSCGERVQYHGLGRDCGRTPEHPIHHL